MSAGTLAVCCYAAFAIGRFAGPQAGRQAGRRVGGRAGWQQAGGLCSPINCWRLLPSWLLLLPPPPPVQSPTPLYVSTHRAKRAPPAPPACCWQYGDCPSASASRPALHSGQIKGGCTRSWLNVGCGTASIVAKQGQLLCRCFPAAACSAVQRCRSDAERAQHRSSTAAVHQQYISSRVRSHLNKLMLPRLMRAEY